MERIQYSAHARFPVARAHFTNAFNTSWGTSVVVPTYFNSIIVYPHLLWHFVVILRRVCEHSFFSNHPQGNPVEAHHPTVRTQYFFVIKQYRIFILFEYSKQVSPLFTFSLHNHFQFPFLFLFVIWWENREDFSIYYRRTFLVFTSFLFHCFHPHFSSAISSSWYFRSSLKQADKSYWKDAYNMCYSTCLTCAKLFPHLCHYFEGKITWYDYGL